MTSGMLYLYIRIVNKKNLLRMERPFLAVKNLAIPPQSLDNMFQFHNHINVIAYYDSTFGPENAMHLNENVKCVTSAKGPGLLCLIQKLPTYKLPLENDEDGFILISSSLWENIHPIIVIYIVGIQQFIDIEF